MNDNLTGKRMKEAARAVQQNWLLSIDEATAGAVMKPSPVLLQALAALTDTEKKASRRHAGMLRWAAAAAVIVIALFGWLAADTRARAAVFSWIKEVTSNWTGYRPADGNNPGAAAYRIAPAWLPEGVGLAEESLDEKHYQAVYQSADGSGFILNVDVLEDGAAVFVDEMPGSQRRKYQMEIAGETVDCYTDETAWNSDYIWVDKTNGVVVSINTTLSEETMKRLWESLFESIR